MTSQQFFIFKPPSLSKVLVASLMVHSSKRTRLSNAHFEQLVLLKSNGYTTDN